MTLTRKQQRQIEKKHNVTAWVEWVYNVQYFIFWHAKTNNKIREYMESVLDGDFGGEPLAKNVFVLPEGGGACMSYVNPTYHRTHVVFQFRDGNGIAHKIAHEAYHAANHVLGRLGVRCDEAYAYYIEYLVRKIMDDMPKEVEDKQ